MLTQEAARVSEEAARSIGVQSLEPRLVDLLAFLQSDRVDRSTAEALLIEFITTWEPGAIEAAEFTMRTLRWPGIRTL